MHMNIKSLAKSVNSTSIPLRAVLMFVLFLIFVCIASFIVSLFQGAFLSLGDKLGALIEPLLRRAFQ